MDATLFPCLGEFDGCRRLMNEIRQKSGFLPGATWLAVYTPAGHNRADYCGTVQGIRDQHGQGAIQNLGSAPEHRRAGLGTSLLLHSLQGFADAGVQRVYLEVTAENQSAIRLYRRIGFTTIRTVYKTVETHFTT
jgi:ribosomal protein S18 acetylase RimI-like enzyme